MNQTAIHQLVERLFGTTTPKDAHDRLFESRLIANLTLIQELYFKLYTGSTADKSFSDLLQNLHALFIKRKSDLKHQDIERLKEGNWYQSSKLVGMQLYVDRFSKDLKGLESKIPYFENLGINFLHLMPLTTRPSGANDGGYAVNSYTDILPSLGSKKDLERLTQKFREKGICLMLDFVVNHTSDEYPWAKKAKEGIKKYQAYYYTYEDRILPDLYEKTLPEIFPQTSPGNFTYIPETDKWVMTVFNSYQWDLNYSNSEVFAEMLKNLVAVANMGVDVVRFDALAFLWKKIGTDSQNLPEAHMLISLFKLCLQVVAPGVVLLAEAIVAPRDIVRYFGEGFYEGNECEIAYNATFMACLWNSVATTKNLLLYKSMRDLPQKPLACTWINYVRCHDDIGLGYDDRLISEIGWNPGAHRRFLLDYYCQFLDWSPAMGRIFMHNPTTGDGRITGSTASLLGLEKGLKEKNEHLIHQATAKILLLHGIILSYGGIPLIYAGDEIGMLNDYSFLNEKDKQDDNRWLNRPIHDWNTVGNLEDMSLPASRIYHQLKRMIALRKDLSECTDSNNLMLHDPGNPHLFSYERLGSNGKSLLVLANFDENPQVINGSWLTRLGYIKDSKFKELISDQNFILNSGLLELPPFGLYWIRKD